ncbi:MAG: DUF4836 family protein [Bacteroides sp.]|nr:DUF4836 family protein [Bacteroides sp.]
MRKYSTPYILLLLSFFIIITSCSEKEEKTEYTHAIPHNATEVIAFNPQSLATKAGLTPHSQQEFKEIQTLLNLLSRPEESGIDAESNAYLFKSPTLYYTAIAFKVTNLQKLHQQIEALAKEGICSIPQKTAGYRNAEIKDYGIGLAYNDGTLIAVYAGSSSEWQKLQSAIGLLMKQGSENSIHTNSHFASMLKQKGDIRLLTTPDSLPFDIRGVLNWPIGTQLMGYLHFENGRIYGNIKQADFEGETYESNQPFHPQDSHELQQAMNTMMRGYPYNIGFTPEELLTLTNLRALMQFTPDDPEVQSLYRLIQKIENMNVRGDKNCCNLTVVLQEKNTNALKQLIEFAKQFIDF